jgi:molybdate/tungstate transport system substrate-binding protein
MNRTPIAVHHHYFLEPFMKRFLCLALMIALLAGIVGCAPREKTTLVLFAAGSLIEPFAALEKEFEAQYPNIDIQAEYHGSIQVIRHATDLHEKIDVIATADHALIPQLMYQVNDPDTAKPYASWYLRFATNRLGLAYTARSKYANEINASNWTRILMRNDVKVGIADPRFDASGYRAMMAIKLAESVLNKPNLFGDIFSGQFRFPVKVDDKDNQAIIRVPEVLETAPESHIVLRGASVQLLALLESGDLDYTFEYESVIQQHKLDMLSLPDTLNLGVAEQNPIYARVTVLLDFQRFAMVKPEFKGEQIGYGITIPSNAPHPQEAELFIAFLLGDKGRALMQAHSHPLFDLISASNYSALPASLKNLAAAP